MALPAETLEKLPIGVRWAHSAPGVASVADRDRPRVLSLGFAELDAALPDGGLPRGAVVELAVQGGSALASSLVLAACREAQQQAVHQGGESPWCAFIDPVEGSLYAPAVQRAGVDIERMLVVRPQLDALSRVALRVVESRAFAVVGLDTVGVLGSPWQVSLANWPRVVRRLASAAHESSATVLLITDAEARRPLPLPVAMRLAVARPELHQLSIEVAKERYGRISGPRTVTWARRAVVGRGAGGGLRSIRPQPSSGGRDGGEQLFA